MMSPNRSHNISAGGIFDQIHSSTLCGAPCTEKKSARAKARRFKLPAKTDKEQEQPKFKKMNYGNSSESSIDVTLISIGGISTAIKKKKAVKEIRNADEIKKESSTSKQILPSGLVFVDDRNPTSQYRRPSRTIRDREKTNHNEDKSACSKKKATEQKYRPFSFNPIDVKSSGSKSWSSCDDLRQGSSSSTDNLSSDSKFQPITKKPENMLNIPSTSSSNDSTIRPDESVSSNSYGQLKKPMEKFPPSISTSSMSSSIVRPLCARDYVSDDNGYTNSVETEDLQQIAPCSFASETILHSQVLRNQYRRSISRNTTRKTRRSISKPKNKHRRRKKNQDTKSKFQPKDTKLPKNDIIKPLNTNQPKPFLNIINPDKRMMKPSSKLQDIFDVIQNTPSGPRRMNACGLLKTLCRVKENRKQLARTDGFVNVLSQVISDPYASETEQQRCAYAIKYLCMENNNQDVLSQPIIMNGLSLALQNTRPSTKQIVSFCLFILSKKERNRKIMWENKALKNSFVKNISISKQDVSKSKIQDKFESLKMQDIQNYGSLIDESDESICCKNGLHGSTINILSIIHKISEDRDLAHELCRYSPIMNILSQEFCNLDRVSRQLTSAIFCNLSRHQGNSLYLMFQVNNFGTYLLESLQSDNTKERRNSYRTLQNLSCDTNCRAIIGSNSHMLELLRYCIKSKGSIDERISAVSTMSNLTQDPTGFLQFSKHEGCMKALVEVATSKVDEEQNSAKLDELNYVAYDTISTISHWMMSTAVSGQKSYTKDTNTSFPVVRPTFRTTSWNQWN